LLDPIPLLRLSANDVIELYPWMRGRCIQPITLKPRVSKRLKSNDGLHSILTCGLK